uniref:Uncharacterized protein n=1 Tax=Rhizophagus irregularis (strain DAOM 181602 / DAOM 197198 / MUCL 43194) TaxID=747089 RepID=U9TBM8_RHIID
MIEMKKFLDNVGGGITSIDDKTKEIIANTNKIKIQNKEIILQNKKIIEILHFTPLNEEINNIFLLNEKLNTADDDDQDSKIEAKRIIPSELRDASQHVIREAGIILSAVNRKIMKHCYENICIYVRYYDSPIEHTRKFVAIVVERIIILKS